MLLTLQQTLKTKINTLVLIKLTTLTLEMKQIEILTFYKLSKTLKHNYNCNKNHNYKNKTEPLKPPKYRSTT